PWQQAAAQFSYHERQPDGTYTHAAHLAEGPLDARPPLAEAMINATLNADLILMYTSFEKTRIRELQAAVPALKDELVKLEKKLFDLKPVVKNNVYHPDFLGSFSLKDILHPLVPELTYNDLVIVDGRIASVEIARLLFVADKIPRQERERVRQDLLNYCERDTWAMVRLVTTYRACAKSWGTETPVNPGLGCQMHAGSDVVSPGLAPGAMNTTAFPFFITPGASPGLLQGLGPGLLQGLAPGLLQALGPGSPGSADPGAVPRG